MPPQIDLVFVPQGAEYRSVCKGLQIAGYNAATVVPIPVGPQGVTQFLQKWLQPSPGKTSLNALLMGLGGSLTPQLSVGDGVIYQTCVDGTQGGDVPMTCDQQIFLSLSQRLSETVIPVTGVSCDRIIHTATEKRQLAQTYQADVVDMEGFALLSGLKSTPISLGIVRVMSDDVHHDLPDLNGAISPEGRLQTLPMAMGMLRQPLPALRLIRGSLKGLQQLEQITTQLFKP
ncbi:hypothetical protein [Acaryochloris sp. CCMEE 5410]|uniref:phosphorylase family protein n=1 Tax=Acaryochloris sp. CCMEE 5410 TaxID=310037 RepID=UPI000248455E|nr:hypothetical protein [Acaryochloris sp. CCMEE 5410]KAI9135285.1 hypothetical protein ON05_019970 [Acaryochloris sp. CCMEE 5410]